MSLTHFLIFPGHLCFDLMEEWIRKHPLASICTSEGVQMFRDIAIFQDYHGLIEFRNAVARFMGKVRGDRITFEANSLVYS
ncbi:unnamed protein product [Coffea canephora]|uniref:Aminotransferase class I/classII large domain-containing protein n=1 Tax=Coffea canephora TaxID=49390 RepID=A0A068UKQ6_COFCA|nr:unnamed protein product [Coffea canephora]